MFVKLAFLFLLINKQLSVNCYSPCSLICFNQTENDIKAPPIYINDTINDAFILFGINCTSNDSLIYGNVSIEIDNKRSIEIKTNLPLDLIKFNDKSKNVTFNITIHGKLLGYSQLILHVEYLNEEKKKYNYTNNIYIDIAVKRKITILDTIFTIVIIIFVCTGTFLIGCSILP
ncbi:unnamed protein product, partial [Rotaria sp. Silwood2]